MATFLIQRRFQYCPTLSCNKRVLSIAFFYLPPYHEAYLHRKWYCSNLNTYTPLICPRQKNFNGPGFGLERFLVGEKASLMIELHSIITAIYSSQRNEELDEERSWEIYKEDAMNGLLIELNNAWRLIINGKYVKIGPKQWSHRSGGCASDDVGGRSENWFSRGSCWNCWFLLRKRSSSRKTLDWYDSRMDLVGKWKENNRARGFH